MSDCCTGRAPAGPGWALCQAALRKRVAASPGREPPAHSAQAPARAGSCAAGQDAAGASSEPGDGDRAAGTRSLGSTPLLPRLTPLPRHRFSRLSIPHCRWQLPWRLRHTCAREDPGREPARRMIRAVHLRPGGDPAARLRPGWGEPGRAPAPWEGPGRAPARRRIRPCTCAQEDPGRAPAPWGAPGPALAPWGDPAARPRPGGSGLCTCAQEDPGRAPAPWGGPGRAPERAQWTPQSSRVLGRRCVDPLAGLLLRPAAPCGSGHSRGAPPAAQRAGLSRADVWDPPLRAATHGHALLPVLLHAL